MKSILASSKAAFIREPAILLFSGEIINLHEAKFDYYLVRANFSLRRGKILVITSTCMIKIAKIDYRMI